MGIRKFFAYMYDTVAKTFKIGDTTGSNYTEFESDGTMRANGEATTFDDAFHVQLFTPTGTAMGCHFEQDTLGSRQMLVK